MAKTTLNIDSHLLHRAKKLAAERDTTLTSVVEEALRATLIAAPAPHDFRLRWTPVRGRSLPDLDVADREALYDAMERGR